MHFFVYLAGKKLHFILTSSCFIFWRRKRKNKLKKQIQMPRENVFLFEMKYYSLGIKWNHTEYSLHSSLLFLCWAWLWNAKSMTLTFIMLWTYLMQLKICHNSLLNQIKQVEEKNDWNYVVVASNQDLWNTQILFDLKWKF